MSTMVIFEGRCRGVQMSYIRRRLSMPGDPGQVNAALRVRITLSTTRLSVGYYIPPTEASRPHLSKR